MKTRLSTRTRGAKTNTTPDEHDFASLDAWAQNLKLEDGRPLTLAESSDRPITLTKPYSRKT